MLLLLFGRYSATDTQMYFAVVVDAARVILRAVGELDLAEQLAGGIELEQPATPGARRTIDREVIQRIGHRAVAHGALEHLDGRHVERLTDLDETLGVKRLPVHFATVSTGVQIVFFPIRRNRFVVSLSRERRRDSS